MEIRKIYFDMDSVLADFDKGVRELCGMEAQDQEAPDPEQENLMWERIRETEHFYDRLDLMPGAKEMFGRVYEKYGDRCEILTGIPRKERGIVTAAEDKAEWTRRMLSDRVKVNTVRRRDKQKYCAGPEDVLIDDRIKTINEWRNLGGTSILHESAEKTLEELEKRGLL